MSDVQETQLPGVGLRHDFVTKGGRGLGVVSHRTGRRDLVVYETEDPETALVTAELSEDEARTLSDLLGGSRVVERLAELPHQLEGLVIDWLHVAPDSPLAGRAIADAGVRSRTGASIVAIVRGDEAMPAPGADDELLAGDIAVVVGTPDTVGRVTELLEGPAGESG